VPSRERVRVESGVLINVQVVGSVPVPAAQVSLRGLMVWNGAPTLVVPVSQSRSLIAIEIVLFRDANGEPALELVIPDIAHPFRTLL